MLTMEGHIDSDFVSTPDGGVYLVRAAAGDYTGMGGTWEDTAPATRTLLTAVNIQQASPKSVEVMTGTSGAVNPQDWKIVHINDGVTYLYPDDSGQFADLLEFSDGVDMRQWRVRQCDNRPWRSYCRAMVERYRGEA
ncbi:hypothetical protein [Pseudomonas sp. dw_358]|uniref:hypothetical protein n=1 Tax=Pseudomonas sp. dw_358 TaxID=2720083 RepID=UPI001BD2CCFB|nr:hypothetical protein [Pseudomonas sp. dw_358]